MFAYSPNTLGLALFNVANMNGVDVDGNELQEGCSPEFYGTLGPNGQHRPQLVDQAGRSDAPDRDEEDEDDVEFDPSDYTEHQFSHDDAGQPATDEDIRLFASDRCGTILGARYELEQIKVSSFHQRFPQFPALLGNSVELTHDGRFGLRFSKEFRDTVRARANTTKQLYLASERFRELNGDTMEVALTPVVPQRYKTDVTRRPEAPTFKKGKSGPHQEAQWLPPGVLAGEGLSKGIRR